MGTIDERAKVAVIQAAPVVLDREATLDKLERLVAEAADRGARLMVLPGREGILTAEIDLGLVTEGRQLLDVAGHYARPDVFRLETPPSNERRDAPPGEED